MINKERILDEFFELVGITCNSRQEREIGDLLKKRLADLGAEVYEDEAGKYIDGTCGNIIANFKGNLSNAPAIMLAAHLDCVVPCAGIKPILKDGIITSDGTTILGSDDKAGVVPILEAIRVLKENHLPYGDLQVVFSVCEEGGLHGSKNIERSKLKADFGFELDADGHPGTIYITAPGQNKIDIILHGKTAHAGIEPEKGINAIKGLGEILINVPQGRIDEETTCNIGIISGGVATNIVPDTVTISCEARSRNKEKLAKITEEIETAFLEGALKANLQAEVKITECYSSYNLSEDSTTVKIAEQAAQRIGLPVKLAGTGGGSDANNFNGYGIPCATLSVGMQKVHTCEEFIVEEDLYKTTEWVLAIVKEAGTYHK